MLSRLLGLLWLELCFWKEKQFGASHQHQLSQEAESHAKGVDQSNFYLPSGTLLCLCLSSPTWNYLPSPFNLADRASAQYSTQVAPPVGARARGAGWRAAALSVRDGWPLRVFSASATGRAARPCSGPAC